MMTVNEVSRMTGVSVRTLQYYDGIGLLKPAEVTQAGYRLYGEEQLMRLQTILLFKELELPLKDIKAMLDSPSFDRKAALRDQLRLLELKKEHTEKIIRLTAEMIEKGNDTVDFEAFNKKELNEYAAEAKKRWGGTKEYEESAKRAGERSEADEKLLADGLMSLFGKFGGIKSEKHDSPAALALVKELKAYITEHYYPCTNVILAGLGQMYTGDERFKKNIDSAGGEGTAEFAAEAIRSFCILDKTADE